MTYSCVDFVDTILDALGIEVPVEAMDDPSAQADLALAAIERLKRPTFYICGIEDKHGEDWNLFRTQEQARGHLLAKARKAWTTAGHGRGNDDKIIEWFAGRDSTFIATIQKLTIDPVSQAEG